MSRPQTHGYEIMALAWLSRLAFASAGDEKIIRVFEAPQGFIRSAENLKLIRSEKQPNTLAFYLPDTAHVLHPEHLARTIKEATRRSLHRGSLDILVVSDLFQGVERNEALKVSFEQVETFLKWCYAQAWSEAVDADELLFDVDVMLLGTELAVDRLRDHHQGGECFIAKKAENALPFDIPGAIPLQTDDGAPHDQSNSQSSFPQHAAIAMGGTFDHLHVGHKILLSMACLLATERVVIGVTDDSMLSKKKHASVLECTQERIDRVASFMTKFCNMVGRTALKHEVVMLQDVAGPAGTDANLTALLFTDETVGGADFIDKEREKGGLKKLDRFTIGLIGASGETDVQGKDAGELAAAKVGSTAIRGWLEKRLVSGKDGKVVLPAKRLPDLNQISTLNGEPRPVGASVPPLGLSNRAIYGAGNEPLDGPSETGQPIGKAIRSIAQHLTRPPVEEELHNHSLWSEVTKLYGHPLELLALDVDSSSGLVASSCKATQAELAGVRLHDSRQGWKEVQCLLGHALGVTRLRFNAQGDRLVTVSRDRSWRMYRRKEDVDSGQEPFELECVGQEAHSRIIYDVAWIDDERFATASRDKTVKIWQTQREGHPINALVTLTLPGPVTAVAVQPKRRAMAIGLESGAIHTYLADTHESWQHRIATGDLHADALSELAWQPNANEKLMLASASEDGMIRLTEIEL
jgi:elongator complex protein 2